MFKLEIKTTSGEAYTTAEVAKMASDWVVYAVVPEVEE